MDVAIIGAGAAGMMCAATLAEKFLGFAQRIGSMANLPTEVGQKNIQDLNIHVFDKNAKPGVKVSLTGGGRCNLTTAIDNKDSLLKKYIRGGQFLSAAISAFSPVDVREWFEVHGVQTKVEDNERVFPVSNKSQSVINVFEKIFDENNVQVHLNENVISIKKVGGKFEVTTDKVKSEFDSVVITTGGNTFPQTGSTGDGYTFAKSLGHEITPLASSLNSFNVNEQWVKDLTGLSFQNAKLSVLKNDGQIVVCTGPTLLTHFGISGPNTFVLAAHLAFETIDAQHHKVITLIPESGLNFEKWNETLLELIKKYNTKLISKALSEKFPLRVVEKFLALAGVSVDKKCSEITKEERKSIVSLLADGIELTLISRNGGNEFVTAGGVNLNEVDRKTMESKFVPGLYFAGEVLDVDGVTGGFNLQAAWATGHLVGQSIIKKVTKT